MDETEEKKTDGGEMSEWLPQHDASLKTFSLSATKETSDVQPLVGNMKNSQRTSFKIDNSRKKKGISSISHPLGARNERRHSCLRHTDKGAVKNWTSIHTGSSGIEELLEDWNLTSEKNFTRTSRMGSSPGSKKHNFFTLHQCLEYFSYTVLSIAISIIIFKLRESLFSDDTNNIRVCGNDLDDEPQICGLLDVLQRGSAQYRVLAAFIIGGFVVSCVSLWRIRRTAYCMLCGATRNLIINLCSIMPIDSKDIKMKETRKLLVRWAVLGYELSILKARGQMDTEEGKSYLNALNLLDKDEWDRMVIGDRHTTVWWWIQVKAKQLADEDIISWCAFHQIAMCVTLSRDKANDLMSRIDRDQPPPYIFVCATLINFNLILISLAKGVEWGIWTHETNGAVWKNLKMYVDIIIHISHTSIFALLFDLCSKLYNPYGPRECFDIPHKAVGVGIRKLARQLCRVELPATMDASSVNGEN